MEPLRTLRRVYLAILLATTVAGILLAINHPRFDTNILSLLPAIHRDHAAEQALKAQTETTGSKVLVVVRGPTSREVERDAERVATDMRASGLFSRIDARVSPDDMRPLVELFTQTPFQLVLGSSDAAKVLPDAKTRIFSPDAIQWLQFSDRDPLLLLPIYLRSMLSGSGRFSISNGYIHADTATSRNVLIVATIRGGAYSRAVQREVVALLDRLSVAAPNSLQTAGVVLFAHESAQRAESEVKTISSLTLAAVVTLLVIIFRSLSVVLVLTGLIVTSFLGALLVTNLVIQEWHGHSIHLITLGFGSCLIGVCIDYGLHFFVAHYSSSARDARPPIRRVSSGLLLGFITTAIGFLGIAFSPFPGLQQLALFCVAGLLFAIVTVYLILPWIAGAPTPKEHLERYSAWSDKIFQPLVTASAAALVVGIVALGLPRLRTIDDIRTLDTPPPHLVEKQRQIGETLGMSDGGTSVVIDGASEEEVLQKQESIKERLEILRQEKRLDGARSMSDLIPSQKRQREIFESYARAYSQSPQSFANYITDMHLSPRALITLQKLALPELTHFVTPTDCVSHDACRSVADLWRVVGQGSVIGSITLDGFKGDPAQLVSGVPGARVVNQADAISHALRLYRQSATDLVVLFYLGVYLVLTGRYGFKRSWRVLVPALVGAAAAVATLGLSGIPLNVFSVFALIVLLGVGIDYAIFFAEDEERTSATGLAVALSALTTMISFGTLSFSSTPALRGFGIVLASGVLFAALLAPLAQGARRKR